MEGIPKDGFPVANNNSITISATTWNMASPSNGIKLGEKVSELQFADGDPIQNILTGQQIAPPSGTASPAVTESQPQCPPYPHRNLIPRKQTLPTRYFANFKQTRTSRCGTAKSTTRTVHSNQRNNKGKAKYKETQGQSCAPSFWGPAIIHATGSNFQTNKTAKHKSPRTSVWANSSC